MLLFMYFVLYSCLRALQEGDSCEFMVKLKTAKKVLAVPFSYKEYEWHNTD
jgi:hypothetical protein